MRRLTLQFTSSALITTCRMEHYLHHCCQINSKCWCIRKLLYTKHRPTLHKSKQCCTPSCSILSHLGWWYTVTEELGWIDSQDLLPAWSMRVHHCVPILYVSVCLCVSAFTCKFVPILSECMMRNRTHLIYSVVGNSTKVFIQNICLI